MSDISDKIVQGVQAKGWSCGIVPLERARDLERDIKPLVEEGLIDSHLVETYIKGFRYDAPDQLPDARSIIVLAFPQPKMRIHFNYAGKEFATIVPPTYANALAVINGVRAALEEITEKEGGKFVKATLPLKTLAARTGLVRYGRNNITYLPEKGSFHRLVAYYTDLDLGMDQWQDREALPACKTCDLCRKACPASVITKDRFLVHVERCLTFLNEMPADKPFPEQVKLDWHNAIVGCMRCQDACPYDKKIKDWTEEGERFSEEETLYLLRGDFSGPRAKEMNEKLERCGLDLTAFPRNLAVILRI